MAKTMRMVASSPSTRKLMKKYTRAKEARPKLNRKAATKGAIKKCNIAPGTVLVLLAGRFRGHRVVFLKQLEKSGLLLVTGPMRVNGVPLRRVNRAYVIATSARVDVSDINLPSEAASDDYFRREQRKKHICKRVRNAVATNNKEKLTEAEIAFFDENKRVANELPEHKRKIQRDLDAQLMPKIKAVRFLRGYLSSRFSLSKGEFPHLLKF